MFLKKAAAAAIAATLILTGSNASAQEDSATYPAQLDSSTAGNTDSSSVSNWENTSQEAGSTELQLFYNENRDVLRPILITLAVLQGIAIIAGPLRTIIYNIAKV